MSLVPAHVRDSVVRRVLRDAQKAGWENLSQQAKAQWYDRWMSEDAVGGIIAGYVGPTRVRVWLKDGPLKHYANATHGVGEYARFLNVSGPTPKRIAQAVLGPQWSIQADSVEIKPLRFTAIHGDQHASVAFGPSRKFRDLLWAALVTAADPTTMGRSVVAIVETEVDPTPESDRVVQKRLATRCGVELTWISIAHSLDSEEEERLPSVG